LSNGKKIPFLQKTFRGGNTDFIPENFPVLYETYCNSRGRDMFG